MDLAFCLEMKLQPIALQINRRYLAPLFLAYDDLIQEKENFIYHCQEELQTLKKRTAEVIKENEQFHLKVSGKVDNNSLLKSSEWLVESLLVLSLNTTNKSFLAIIDL